MNLARFEKYLESLADYDLENYKEVAMDLKYFESKTGRKKFSNTHGIVEVRILDFLSNSALFMLLTDSDPGFLIIRQATGMQNC